MLAQPSSLTTARKLVSTSLLASIAIVSIATSGNAASPYATPLASPVMADGKASIIRDEWGMAHIYAKREQDGFYALGYATAEDRLEQILLMYLATRGELAAKFGPGSIGPDKVSAHLAGSIQDTVASDTAVRRFRVLESARENLKTLPPQYRRNLEAYIEGLNRYLADHPEKRPAWAPELEPAMPLAAFHQLVSEPAQICPSRIAAYETKDTPKGEAVLKGSNAWVAGPSRVADGGVLFSSDSHGPWSAIGTLFYAWRMNAGDFNFQAFEPTGTAMPFFGHSPHFAWGWTEGPRHPGDCYRVETRKDDPGSYEFDGKIQRFETVPYRIEVKGSVPVTGNFEYTRHNGVLSAVVERRGQNAFVVSYSSIDRVGRGHGQMYRMAKAKDRKQLRSELAGMDIYPANLLIGGADGTVMYVRPGRVPVRAPGIDPTRVVDGNTAKTAWRGFVSLDETVKLENPAQGYVVNDNVSPDMMYPTPVIEAAGQPSYLAFDAGQTTLRQRRHMELLDQAKGLTDEDAIRLTMDEKVFGFDHWASHFRSIDKDQLGDLEGLAGYLEQLQQFDGRLIKDSTPALAFSYFVDAITKLDKAAAYRLTLNVVEGKPITPEQRDLIIAAVKAAHADLVAHFGTANAIYGDRYRLSRGGKNWSASGGSFIFSGMEKQLDLQGGHYTRPFVASALRTMRFKPQAENSREQIAFCCQRVPFVVAFHPGKPITSYSQFLPGLSDDPASTHFDDQLALASEGKLRPNYFELDEILENGRTMKVLETGRR